MKNTNESVAQANCYVALELSRSKWLVGALLPGSDQVVTISVSGGDTSGLLSALNRLVARQTTSDIQRRGCVSASRLDMTAFGSRGF